MFFCDVSIGIFRLNLCSFVFLFCSKCSYFGRNVPIFKPKSSIFVDFRVIFTKIRVIISHKKRKDVPIWVHTHWLIRENVPFWWQMFLVCSLFVLQIGTFLSSRTKGSKANVPLFLIWNDNRYRVNRGTIYVPHITYKRFVPLNKEQRNIYVFTTCETSHCIYLTLWIMYDCMYLWKKNTQTGMFS